MGKFLSNLVVPLLILLGGSLLTAFFKGMIDDIANQNRLKAEVELAPLIQPVEPKEKELDLDGQPVMLRSAYLQSSGVFNVARVTLQNDSGSKLTDISFKIPSDYIRRGVLIYEDGRAVQIKDLNKIKIPDMGPGEQYTAVFEGSFGTWNFSDEFESFSSQGRFRINYSWPDDQEISSDGFIDSLLSFVIWGVGSVSAILLLIIFAIGYSQHSNYVKLLLTYTNAYEAEKQRFWQEPKKFTPDWDLLNESYFKPHGLFGDPDGECPPSSEPKRIEPQTNPAEN